MSRVAARKCKIDALLQRAVEAGDVPGIIAMATDCSGVIYEGAYGKRVLGQRHWRARIATHVVVALTDCKALVN